MELERFKPEQGPQGELHAQHVSRYTFASRYTAGKRVVDVACGTGYGSALLRREGALTVTGVDLSAEAIAHANAHYVADGITFTCGDVSILKRSGPTDCLVSFETIEHLEDPDALLAPIGDILTPGGLFIVSTPVRQGGALSDRPVNPFHVREWNEEEFDRLLSRYFPDRNYFYQYVYRKRPYPLSRTLNRLALAMFLPQRSGSFTRFPVVERAWDLPEALVCRGYMVVVCSGKAG